MIDCTQSASLLCGDCLELKQELRDVGSTVRRQSNGASPTDLKYPTSYWTHAWEAG